MTEAAHPRRRRVRIVNDSGGKGLLTKVYIDDEEWAVSSVTVVAKAHEFIRVNLEFYAEVEIDADAIVEPTLRGIVVRQPNGDRRLMKAGVAEDGEAHDDSGKS